MPTTRLHKAVRRELAGGRRASTPSPAARARLERLTARFLEGQPLEGAELEAIERAGHVRKRRRGDGACAGPRVATAEGMAAARSLEQRKRPLAERVPRGATLRRQWVLCGKANCRRWHGPYWYAFWKESGRTRSAYVGKDDACGDFLKARGAHAGDALDETIDAPRTPRRGKGRAAA